MGVCRGCEEARSGNKVGDCDPAAADNRSSVALLLVCFFSLVSFKISGSSCFAFCCHCTFNANRSKPTTNEIPPARVTRSVVFTPSIHGPRAPETMQRMIQNVRWDFMHAADEPMVSENGDRKVARWSACTVTGNGARADLPTAARMTGEVAIHDCRDVAAFKKRLCKKKKKNPTIVHFYLQSTLCHKCICEVNQC